jgi:large subunit ribosomal protein L25
VATSKDLKLSIEPRSKTGTTGSNALRHAGKIPAVLYGHGSTPEHIALDAHAFEDLLHHGGRHGIISLTNTDGTTDTAMVREVQLHPVSRRVVHADLQRVSAKESIHAKLAVVTVGIARGIKESGGVMDVVTHELEVSGPADSIPEHLEVDVTELGMHEHISAGDVKLPDGFKMLTPADTTVVAIESSRTERDVEAAASGPGETAEPQVIGAKPEAG